MTQAIASEAAASIRDLQAKWKRVSRQHVALGAACGCGIGIAFAANDLEEDICDFIEESARREKRNDVAAFIAGLPRPAGGATWKLADLLARLESECEYAAFLAPRLVVSLASFDQQHGGARFVCAG